MKSETRIVIASLIFLIVFVVLGIPYTTMGFDSDCFGLVFFSAQIKNFHDVLIQLFAPVQSCYAALNELSSHQQEGFLSYFRPFMTLSHYFCYRFFGLKPYAYHLVNVGLHALTTSLVFVIFSQFTEIFAAFLLALLFAFFPALTPAYVGVTSHVVPTYVFAALMILAYSTFLKNNHTRWHVLSALFFLLSLLCYEILIIFPLVLVLFLAMFGYERIFYRSYFFFVTLAVYLNTRFALLGFPAAHEQKIFNLWSLPGKIVFNTYQAVKPFWGLHSAPKFIAFFVSLIFLVGLCVAWLYAPEQQRRLFFYCSSFFMLAWPVFFITPDGRYFYPAIPVFVLLLYEILTSLFAQLKTKSLLPIYSYLALFICWSVWHGTQALITRSFVTHQRDLAFQGLADYYRHIKDLRLIMLGTLHCYNEDTLLMQQGMTQAARLFFNNSDLEAYHVTQAKIYSHKRTQKSFSITKLNNGFRFTSPEPENLFFMIPHTWNEETPIPFSMGTIVVHKKSASWKASDISFLFNSSWLTATDLARTKFVTFDLSLWSFVELKLDEKS